MRGFPSPDGRNNGRPGFRRRPLIENQLRARAERCGRYAGDRGEIRRIPQAFGDVAERIDLALDRRMFHESLIANSTEAIISKTLQGIVTSWNPAAEEIFGYSEDEMIGAPVAILIPADRLDEEAGILGKISRGERIRNYQTWRRRKNGEVFPVSVTVSPIRDIGGAVVGVSKIARDITGAVSSAEALKRADERYALVLEGMSLGIWEWDLSSNAVFCSARMRAIIGLKAESGAEYYGQFMARLHPDDRQQVEDRLRAHLERREKFDMVCRLRVEAGRYAWVHATGQAAWDKNGKPVRVAGSVEDITQRTRLENERVDMLEKLKKSNKDLDEFAYAASHDLRAPLRVIDNTSQWLLEDLEPHLTPETRENMNLLRGRVKRMEKLLGDLLEYSRIGRNRDERFAEVVKGGELLENILELLSPGPGFSVAAQAGFEEITVMRMPLQQVLMNLIGNAVKHHDKPEGTVRLSMEDLGSMYAFTVEDDGPGIPAQFHDKVFEMFRTLKPRDQVEGSGMGLALVRKNVELFGGTISLDSSPGQGCRFRFTWPKSQPLAPVES